MVISGGLTSKILVMALTVMLMLSIAPITANADQDSLIPETNGDDKILLYIEAVYPDGFKWEYVEGETLDLTGLGLVGYFTGNVVEELYDFTVYPEHGTVLGNGSMEIGLETVIYNDGDDERRFFFTITIYPAIQTVGITTANGRARIDFPIASANGKGYAVYLSTTNKTDSFSQYDQVNYNSKGVNIKGLSNDTTYYGYIEYVDLNDVIFRSRVFEFTPQKP